MTSEHTYKPGDRVRARQSIAVLGGRQMVRIVAGTVQPGSSFDASVPSTIDGKTLIRWDSDGKPADASGGGAWLSNDVIELLEARPDSEANLTDWSAVDDNHYPEHTCTCRCGTDFRSHAKFVVGFGLVSRKACPRCGSTEPRRAASDPETFALKT